MGYTGWSMVETSKTPVSIGFFEVVPGLPKIRTNKEHAPA
jgi:hypothetical protein